MDASFLATLDWTAILDCLAVIIGAVTGALFAVARELDIVGTVALGVVTAYGGGVIRDVLLASHGFFFMQHPNLIVACAVISAIVFALGRHAPDLDGWLFYADALSMAWFALAGATKSWNCEIGIVLTVILGVVTAVGGGALRDICTGETPSIFQPGNFYAVSAFAGVVFFVTCTALNVSVWIASIGCVVVAFALTLASRKFDWKTKRRNG